MAILIATSWAIAGLAPAHAHDFWFADHRKIPGTFMACDDHETPREVFRRVASISNGASDSVPKIAALVPGKMAGQVFFISGLDRYIFRADGGRQVLVHTHPAQVRDLSFGERPDLLYYSVVPTPQNGEPVQDGEVFSVNLKSKTQELVWSIRQADLPDNWWGAFAVRGGKLYLATYGPPTQVFEWTAEGAQPILSLPFSCLGFDVDAAGQFYLASTDGRVYRAGAGEEPQLAFEASGSSLSDVALRRFDAP